MPLHHTRTGGNINIHGDQRALMKSLVKSNMIDIPAEQIREDKLQLVFLTARSVKTEPPTASLSQAAR